MIATMILGKGLYIYVSENEEIKQLETIKYMGKEDPCKGEDIQLEFLSERKPMISVTLLYSSETFCGFSTRIEGTKCGDQCYWIYESETKTLIIKGEEMDDYLIEEEVPWKEMKSAVEHIE